MPKFTKTGALLALILSWALTGCGGQGGSVRAPLDEAPLTEETGFESYTISGNPEVYRELKREFKDQSPALARSIQKVLVKRDEDFQYQISIQFTGAYFNLQELVFKGELASIGHERHAILTEAEVQPKQYGSRFSLGLHCRSLDCQMIEMKLTERDGPKFLSEALWIYQERKTQARFYPTDTGSVDELNISQEETESVQRSVVIVEGPSYSEIVVRGLNSKDEDEPLLVIETDLKNTEEEAREIRSITVRGLKSDFSGQLQGNDPETGDLMLDVEKRDGSGSVRVIVEGPKSQNERRLQRSFVEPAKGSLNPRGISPEIDRYTNLLDEYAENPEVAKRVELWLDRGSACSGCRLLSRQDAKKFLTHLQAVTPQILEASALTGTSPEKAYLLAIESEFLKRSDFPIQVASAPNSSAAGPWQLQTGTALEAIQKGQLPFKVYGLQSGRSLHPNDDRNYFYESTVMALKYFSTFPKALKEDPALQIAGYYQGPYGMADIVRRHAGKHTGFAELARFNAIPKPKDTADYVYSVIALRFVGINPEVQGLDIPELSEIPAELLPKLKNPHR